MVKVLFYFRILILAEARKNARAGGNEERPPKGGRSEDLYPVS